MTDRELLESINTMLATLIDLLADDAPADAEPALITDMDGNTYTVASNHQTLEG